MSADNLIRIKKKENGLYQVRHESASSLAHALADIEPTEEELLIEVVADDVDYDNARKKARDFIDEIERDGYEVEYGIVELCGDLPRIELFARKEKTLFPLKDWNGWDVWGNEVESDIEF